MPERERELVRQAVDRFNGRDFDSFVALMDDEIEIESRLVAIEGGYHGHDGVRRWWNNFLDVIPDYTLEVESIREEGDVLIVKVRGEGHGADSDAPLVETIWMPMRFHRDRCVWWRNCMTEAEALDAAGLAE